MNPRIRMLALFAIILWSVSVVGKVSAHLASDAPRYTADGRLQRPDEYREWVYLTSGLGMTYGPTQPQAGQPRFFDNVFVNRDAYDAFLRTGKWPEGTTFVLEIRRSAQHVSIDNGGHTQTESVGIEVEVKDSARFADTGGWGFFDFGNSPAGSAVERLPGSAGCYSCHRTHTAVENTFVQFYPTLFEVAKRFGTLKTTYDPQRKVSR
jgi:hypothetical protein